jgi:hypothetical protein
MSTSGAGTPGTAQADPAMQVRKKMLVIILISPLQSEGSIRSQQSAIGKPLEVYPKI